MGPLDACSVCVLTFLFPSMHLLPRCFPQALLVHFEADTERRKLGLPHRVNFLGRSSLDPEYTQTEEVELHNQRHLVCTTAAFQLNVSNAHLLLLRAAEIGLTFDNAPSLIVVPRRRTFGTNCVPSHWR